MNIGDKFVIVAERGLFATQKSMWSGDGPTVQSIDGLIFIQIEVIEERQVKGDYTDAKYIGFRAKGSDGFFYLNQWDYYDQASTDPRSNWQREFIEGVDYHMEGNTFVWEDGVDKIDLILNWDARSILKMWNEDRQEDVLNYIRETFRKAKSPTAKRPALAIAANTAIPRALSTSRAAVSFAGWMTARRSKISQSNA